MISYPYEANAIRVEQPLGVFYLTVLPAELLLDVAFADELQAVRSEGETVYKLRGTQRIQSPRRLEEIANYIGRSDASFPNAIILAANYRREDGFIEGEESSPAEGDGVADQRNESWMIKESNDGCSKVVIPTAKKLASVIDGQHRLFAFAHASSDRRAMQLPCAIFLDLPKPFQAQLFATINTTQKRVDKSLTLELFGYNVDEEPPALWTPEKLAVSFARRLNLDEGSPLSGRIKIAPRNDMQLESTEKVQWKVSTAVVVDGILRLITSNPRRDSNALNEQGKKRVRGDLGLLYTDKSPLREFYLNLNDALIYSLVRNYLMACRNLFWSKANLGSYITKSVGVQALFDILRIIAPRLVLNKDISVKKIEEIMSPASSIDFSEADFQKPAGSGRTAIRKAIEARLTTGDQEPQI